MGRALEVLGASVTAPGATLTAATAFTGNTRTIRNFPEGADARIAQVWIDSQGAGSARIRSPRMHDAVQGMRFDHVAGRVVPLLPYIAKQRVYPQDELTIEISGSATAGDVEVLAAIIGYTDLPGIDARLAMPEELEGRIRNILAVFNSISKSAASGYSGEEAIDENATLKANTDYAILGFYVDTEVSIVRYRGPSTGNLGLGGPGEPDIADITKDWFVLLSQQQGLPCVPLFNASDRANTLIDVGGDENAATVEVTTILAELVS